MAFPVETYCHCLRHHPISTVADRCSRVHHGGPGLIKLSTLVRCWLAKAHRQQRSDVVDHRLHAGPDQSILRNITNLQKGCCAAAPGAPSQGSAARPAASLPCSASSAATTVCVWSASPRAVLLPLH